MVKETVKSILHRCTDNSNIRKNRGLTKGKY